MMRCAEEFNRSDFASNVALEKDDHASQLAGEVGPRFQESGIPGKTLQTCEKHFGISDALDGMQKARLNDLWGSDSDSYALREAVVSYWPSLHILSMRPPRSTVSLHYVLSRYSTFSCPCAQSNVQ